MAGENILLGEYSEVRINGTLFDNLSGEVTIRRVKHDINSSANATHSRVRGGRWTLAMNITFQLADDQQPHAGPYLIMNGADEYVDLEYFPEGVASGRSYHAPTFFAESFSLRPNANQGGRIEGIITGESSDIFTKPDDV